MTWIAVAFTENAMEIPDGEDGVVGPDGTEFGRERVLMRIQGF
ncbi:MAG: hypothetical protein PWR25_1169 [Euryarchaeota archaeon]|jgi:hypothetical protein|nr:hypothetical protein [Euryarchaeota archaeon]MDN5339475.1 hypothetical protein [Euryarchaeota archaeon]